VECSRCGAQFLLPHGAGDPILYRDGATTPATPQQQTPPPETNDDPILSPQDEAVLVEVQQLQDPKPSWSGAILVLVVSLVLYLAASRVRVASWQEIAIFVGTLAFHELGHYLAMRWFGYRNLRMFFIPFFGAAVSGHHYNVPGWKKAIVALAGPVPGIVIGAPLGVLGLALKEPFLIQLSVMLLILNGFNLLPFLPLDGGWVVHAVLFVRHPVLDAVFRAVAAVGLLAIAVLTGSWVLIVMSIFMLMAIPLAWRLANVTHRLRQEGVAAVSPDADTIPASAALKIIAAVRPVLPAQSPPKLVAQHVINVFSALNAAPPGVLATLGLLVVHAVCFLAAAVMAIVVIALKHKLG